ncbi:MAG: PASTA domain-containing protein, partial [Desulfobacterales bacterium]|nr:PASTA domain-containing protein [Desulfobacterales bacterium]
VISQNPLEGTAVILGTAVDLVVSLGPVMVPVPGVVGQPQADAETTITAAGLIVGTVTTANSATVPAGNVISQNPVEGTAVILGTAVDLVVSLGPVVTDDLIPPILTISANPSPVNKGENITITIVAVDNVGVVLLELNVDGIPVPLDANGIGIFSSNTPGSFLATATAQDAAGNSFSDSVEFIVIDPDISSIPTAEITSPEEDSELYETTNVIGTASGSDFMQYTLEYAPHGSNDYIIFAEDTSPITDNVLGVFDPTLLANGLYTIRLTAISIGGQYAVSTKIVQVIGKRKVGLFTLSFKDKVVPIGKFHLEVSRTYDSRDKTKGDFGYGWKLDLNDAKLVINRKPGEFWRQYSSGGWFPTYYLVETKSHLVTINFGDEEELNFRPQPNPQSSSIIPIEYLDSMNYVPVGDTRGTVVPNIQPYFVYGGIGEVELLDLSVNLYNPTGYKYTMPDGYSYYFDNSNSVSQLRYNLSSITDPNGTTITLNPSGLIRSDGLSIEFIRDAEGRITSLLDPNGNEITYEYNIRGDLAAVIDAEGNRTEFIYDANHNLLEINDPLGRAVQRQEFDEEGHLIAITDAKGGRIEIEYDLGSNTEIVRDKRGNPTIYEYDINGNVVQKTEFPEVNGTPQAVVTSYVYDANNNLISQTKPNGSITEFTYSAKDELLTKTIDAGGLNLSTIYTYDSAGRVLTVTDPIGNVVTNTYDSNGNLTSRTDRLGNVTTYNYNAQGLVSRKTDPLGNYVEYTYNPLGNKIREEMFSMGGISLRLMEFTYDNNGNKLKETLYVTKNGTSIPLTTVYEYNNNDRIVSVTDPMSNVTRTEYDATEQKIADINPLGLRIEYIYDNIGNLIETKYPDGTSTLCEYDSDGNRISVTNRNGQKTTYEFDAVKRIVQASYPDGATRQTFFDEVGNFIAEVDERGNRIDHTYDAAGRRISTIQPLVFNAATGTNERPLTLYEYDANGNRTAVTDGNGNRTEFTYDKENRKTVTTFPDTNIATVDYDALGREIERTDTSGLTTTFQYDELGHLIRVSLPPPKAGDPNPETLYAYDEAGNLISQTDANGHVTLFEYDLLGRRTARQLPGGQRETFQYDAAGNLIRHTDFNGATIIYTYNEAGRQVLIEHPNGFSVATVYAGEGQRIRVNDSQGETVLLYDGRNRLLEVTYPSGQFVSNIYDDAGNKIQVITPGGVTNYTFDALNRLSTVTDPAFGITEYLYDAVGNQVEVINANGSYGEYTYNSRNQLEKLTNLKSDSSVINSYEYVLDTNGLRTQVNEHDGSSVSYIYDNNHRLIRETRTGTDPYNISYSYDPVGNRISMERDGIITAYAYDSNDRLLSEGPVNYDYDANGNVIKKTQGTDITTYEYDFSNRLIQSTDFAGETTAYVYDFDGNRIKKQDNSSEVNYLVDICSNCGLSQVLEERDGSGTLETLYVYGNDLLSQNHGGVVSYYHYDGLGSTRALTSDSEEVTDTYTFDAYGKLNSSSGITQNNYLFAGEQFDPNVGLYYLRARYYDQNTGRFFSMDPVMGDPQTPISLHRYLYANDNPVNFVDPTGMMTLIEINISISIQTTLRSIYTKNLLKFFFKAVKIIYCTIEPAYRMQDIGFDMIFSGLPGGELLINQSRDQIAKGFAAIGAAIVDTYKQIGNDIISVKTEVSGLLKDLYDAYNSGTIPIPVPDELAKLLEFKKRLEGWMQSFADALEDVDSILHGDKCAQFTVIAKYADWVIDKIPDF